MFRGGPILVPSPDRGIQPVDVQDLSTFILDCIERDQTGIFNVAPAQDSATFVDMLRACVDVTAERTRRRAELIPVSEDWLVEQGVAQWTELPLWRNAKAPWGLNVNRAHGIGLRCRPLTETVADTWAWLSAGGQAVNHERSAEHGIAPEKETLLIERWRAERRLLDQAVSQRPD
jgi:hypothetical protein